MIPNVPDQQLAVQNPSTAMQQMNNFLQDSSLPLEDRFEIMNSVFTRCMQIFEIRGRKLDQQITHLTNEVRHLQDNNENLQHQLEAIEAEKYKEKLIKDYQNSAGIINNIVLATGLTLSFINPINTPASVLALGMSHLYQKSEVSNHLRLLEAFEQEYRTNHPNCSRLEALKYADNKVRETIQELANLDTPNAASVDGSDYA
ncbi:hypothetical protein [Candidatus Protochlamydia amoebophila]|uniref:Uncharacterized protein n=1 Tax=Candidatus Protochlamydia amoebophila TaxID=362787 RepID=A0A0C1K0I3_9BACT|nr:hypothetical protein [Candidatus Protochlamydia amoebophila]KIC73007.1 hypothetical protein DB44_BS00030 [Candidatus Protochlamydia amoebophila]